MLYSHNNNKKIKDVLKSQIKNSITDYLQYILFL